MEEYITTRMEAGIREKKTRFIRPARHGCRCRHRLRRRTTGQGTHGKHRDHGTDHRHRFLEVFQAGNLLKTIAPIKLRHLTQDPKMIGGDFSLSLFPKDGAGAYVYADGGSGGFWKRDGCKFSGPEGIYPIQEASYSLWIDTMKNYYNTAPGTVEKVKTT